MVAIVSTVSAFQWFNDSRVSRIMGASPDVQLYMCVGIGPWAPPQAAFGPDLAVSITPVHLHECGHV